jgi:hypothetical protein
MITEILALVKRSRVEYLATDKGTYNTSDTRDIFRNSVYPTPDALENANVSYGHTSETLRNRRLP